MVGTSVYKVKVKTGSSWIAIDKVEICYYLIYKDFFDKEPSCVEIRFIIVPSWAEQWKSMIRSYVEGNPSCLSKDIIEVT